MEPNADESYSSIPTDLLQMDDNQEVQHELHDDATRNLSTEDFNFLENEGFMGFADYYPATFYMDDGPFYSTLPFTDEIVSPLDPANLPSSSSSAELPSENIWNINQTVDAAALCATDLYPIEPPTNVDINQDILLGGPLSTINTFIASNSQEGENNMTSLSPALFSDATFWPNTNSFTPL